MLTEEEYRKTRARIDAYEQWRGERTSVATADIPPGLDVTNDERSSVQVYEFVRDVPTDYLAYVALPPRRERPLLTTWTGDVLGDIVERRPPFRDNLGGERQYIKVAAINGRMYAGWYFKSAGDYARVKLLKVAR